MNDWMNEWGCIAKGAKGLLNIVTIILLWIN